MRLVAFATSGPSGDRSRCRRTPKEATDCSSGWHGLDIHSLLAKCQIIINLQGDLSEKRRAVKRARSMLYIRGNETGPWRAQRPNLSSTEVSGRSARSHATTIRR